ncbi:hypothetical protein IDM40_20375 [Nocardiopsis sp. HNM0947]|uniref:Exonuclease n=1 Tax=Nocardiopsis coralli TaxID=2772213 RepID=A0ABR9PB11_9ACTN|nr:hypothetical protein [Nocardiopsis coralli]MBE3001031.1 hypothetical protein [Nocardiopsis coralli]
MTGHLFVDAKTTGIRSDLHDVWEIAIIDDRGHEYAWQVAPDLTHADQRTLEAGRFHSRHFTATDGDAPPGGALVTAHRLEALVGGYVFVETAAREAADLLNGAEGSYSDLTNHGRPDRFLAPWLRRHGQEWHGRGHSDLLSLGWSLLIPSCPEMARTSPCSYGRGISRSFGVEPEHYARYTALGTCRWLRALWEAMSPSLREA